MERAAGRPINEDRLLHKLRRAMVDVNREPLKGAVEVDESWVGGKQEGLKGGRQTSDRKAALVAVAVERRATSLGRVGMEIVPNASATILTDFVVRNVRPGSTIRSDA